MTRDAFSKKKVLFGKTTAKKDVFILYCLHFRIEKKPGSSSNTVLISFPRTLTLCSVAEL